MQGRNTGLGLTNLNESSTFQGIGNELGCLAFGSGITGNTWWGRSKNQLKSFLVVLPHSYQDLSFRHNKTVNV